MQNQSEDKLLEAVLDIHNWIRAAAYGPVKASLEVALPDLKSRTAYQMHDGSMSMEQIRIACKMSPNAVVALANRCTSMGLMKIRADKKRIRLFDLSDFGLIDVETSNKSGK
jgi:hypothetical protein